MSTALTPINDLSTTFYTNTKLVGGSPRSVLYFPRINFCSMLERKMEEAAAGKKKVAISLSI